MFFHKTKKPHTPKPDERRSSQRMSANIDTKFFFGSIFYSGTILNVSENGLFINTKINLPSETIFIMFIPVEKENLKVIARVRRTALKNRAIDGIGVEILNPPVKYKDFVIKKLGE